MEKGEVVHVRSWFGITTDQKGERTEMRVNVLSTVMIISFIIVLALLFILLAIHCIVLIQQQSSLCRVSYKPSMCLAIRSLPDAHRRHSLLLSIPLPPSIHPTPIAVPVTVSRIPSASSANGCVAYIPCGKLRLGWCDHEQNAAHSPIFHRRRLCFNYVVCG